MADEPTPPPRATVPPGPAALREPRAVDAGHGASWWGEGWRLFTPAVGAWLLTVVIAVVLNILLAIVPFVGNIAGQILFPVFTGGLMLGCRATDRGEPLTLGHLFAGFAHRTGQLLVVGVIYTAIALAIALAVFGVLALFFGATVLTQLLDAGDTISAGLAFGQLILIVLIGMLLFVLLLLPLIMAVWFAPALVVFQGIVPWAAMKLSFDGCMKNFVPFLIYGLIGLGLAIAASIPFGLGWFVLVPVTITSIYASYCDIFEDEA